MTTTNQDARTLAKVAARLRREAAEFRTAGLDDRAVKVDAELETVETRLAELKAARQDSRLDEIRAKADAQAAHDAHVREQERAAQRRGAAAEWLSGQSWNDEPLPAVETLAAASREGHAASDVLSVSRRFKRRADGIECLAPADGPRVLRSRFEPLERPVPAA